MESVLTCHTSANITNRYTVQDSVSVLLFPGSPPSLFDTFQEALFDAFPSGLPLLVEFVEIFFVRLVCV